MPNFEKPLDNVFAKFYNISIAILAICCFDAMFDTQSALPDLSQNFETFILKNCQEYSS